MMSPNEIKDYANMMRGAGITELHLGEVKIFRPDVGPDMSQVIKDHIAELSKKKVVTDDDILFNPMAGIEDHNG